MATYFVNSSKFKPFEFEQMVQPVLAAQEAHVDLENLLGDLRQKASVWENLANELSDPETFKMYLNYANDLRSLAEILTSQGLTPLSRSGLMSMRERYGSEIVPIENAYLRRFELAKLQQEMLAKDLNIRFDRMASATSLDDYMKNPELSYRGVSGTVLANQVAAASDSLAKEIRENPDKYKKILGGQYFEVISRKGFSAEEVNAAINGDPNANPLLTQVVNDAMSSAGVDQFDPRAQQELKTMASQGLYKSIGGEESKYLDNWLLKLLTQEALYRSRRDTGEETGLPLNTRPYAPLPRTQANRAIVGAFGGDKLQKSIEILNEIKGKNSLGITDDDIIQRRQDLSSGGNDVGRVIDDGSSFSRMELRSNTSGGYGPGSTGTDKRSEKEKTIDRLIAAMDDYGVSTIGQLNRATQIASEMTAITNNDYRFQVTNDHIALENTQKLISGAGDGALRIIKNGVAQGTSLNKKLIEDVLLSKGTKTIVFDTNLNEMTLSVAGERYIINPALVSSVLESDIKELKRLDPDKIISTKRDDKTNKKFSEYYGEYAGAYAAYDKVLLRVLASYGAWFNSYAMTQRGTESARDELAIEPIE